MNSLDWLIYQRLSSLTGREYDWVFEFGGGLSLTVTCLWRLLLAGRICLTSEDHGQQFGLPAPIDAAAKFNGLVSGALVTKVSLQSGTLDLEIRFGTGHVLQILPDSSGYESWIARNPPLEFIAVGGGELATMNSNDYFRGNSREPAG
ncbi:MAG: hypothetical protein U0572_11330 [Phycisphaerales bacterium]